MLAEHCSFKSWKSLTEFLDVSRQVSLESGQGLYGLFIKGSCICITFARAMLPIGLAAR